VQKHGSCNKCYFHLLYFNGLRDLELDIWAHGPSESR
jgi:hypothetical protein